MESKFPRTIEALDDVFNFVDGFLDANRVSAASRYAIGMAIEEVFTNMVKYNPKGSGSIGIRLERDEGKAKIDVSDFDADPFDPTLDRGVDVVAPIEQRTPGGLGLFLVHRLMDGMDYAYHDRHCTISMVKSLDT